MRLGLNKGCERHTCGLAIYIIKKYLKEAKEELWKIKYFTMQKYINLQKILFKKKPKSFKILLLFCIPFGIEW
jgi:hypothetical protein